MEEEHICCICGKRFKGYGNTPEPLKHEGVCCNECNIEVIKARVDEFFEKVSKEN